METAEKAEPKKAKVARQSWERTQKEWDGKFKPDNQTVLLMNYLSGKQLDAGRDCVRVLEEAKYSSNLEGILYKALKDKVHSKGHTFRTIEEALRKLKREHIAVNEAVFAYKKHHKPHKGNKPLNVDEDRTPKESSMAGRWRISWGAYVKSHEGFGKKGKAIIEELEKKYDHKNIPKQEP